MSGIRLVLAPQQQRDPPSRRMRVTGASVRLTNLGADPLSEGTHAARLGLLGRYIDEPRSSPGPFHPFATLECQTLVPGEAEAPRLLVPAEARVEYDPPQDEASPAIRRLSLEFTGEGIDPDVEQARVVIDVPPPSEEERTARFFELGVELEVNGAVAAAHALNDILDVPLLPVELGLKMEWPDELDEHVPSDLALRVRQGGRSRQLSWSDGVVSGPGRQFLFREILGAAPVTLEAVFGDERVVLFEEQDTSETEKVVPTWTETLEDALGVVEEGDVDFETTDELGPAKPVTEAAEEEPDFGAPEDL